MRGHSFHRNSTAAAALSREEELRRFVRGMAHDCHLHAGSVTQDSGVSVLSDISGNGNDATQTTPADRPTYNAKNFMLNGKPSVDLAASGSTDALDMSYDSGTSISDFTVWCVVNCTRSTGRFLIYFPSASDAWALTHRDGSAGLNTAVLKSSGGAAYVATAPAQVGPQLIVARVTGGTVRVYRNGTEIASGSCGSHRVNGGVIGDPGQAGSGLIQLAEFGILERAITDDELSKLYSYALSEYRVATVIDNNGHVSWASAVEGASLETLSYPVTDLCINGQSNAESDPSGTTGFLGGNILGWNEGSEDFSLLVDDAANVLTAGGASGGGRVLSGLAREQADAGAPVVRCHAGARTSQAITYFGTGSAVNAYYHDGTQHASLNNYNRLADQIEKSGIAPQVYVFIQGESNAGDSQATYYAALKPIITSLTLLIPGMRIVLVSTIGDSSSEIGGASVVGVRAAEAQLASENPHVDYIDMTDVEGNATYHDGVHYTAAGYALLVARIDSSMSS